MIKEERLVVRRGDSAAVVLPHEVRRLVDALMELATRWPHALLAGMSVPDQDRGGIGLD